MNLRPPNEKAPTGQGQGSQIHTTADRLHSDALREISQEIDHDCPRSPEKRLADITAKLALKGFALYPLTDESFLVTRWNQSRTLPSIVAAERFLAIVGGVQ